MDGPHGVTHVVVIQTEEVLHDAHVLRAGEVAVPRRGLDERADPAQEPVTVLARHRLTENPDAPAARADEGQEHLHRGRFAGAVGSQEPVHDALGNPQVHVVNDLSVAVALAELMGGDDVAHRAMLLCLVCVVDRRLHLVAA